MVTLADIATGAGTAELFGAYSIVPDGVRDEAFAPDGTPRRHWHRFVEWLTAGGAAAHRDVARDLNRLRVESGVAFSPDGAAGGEDADTLPVLLCDADWAELEAGIIQRAMMAEMAIADVYTDGRIVSSGIVPPGLVYGGPAFAAHCASWDHPPRQWLHAYEANVARGADGKWIVLADRLDTPLGDGWLLANRVAAAQAMAEPFSDIGVRRLASHFSAFQNHLDQLLGWDGRLALLTGGQADARFFSHAYFARYIGAGLIEPADLTVRDGAAFVKTLDGLKRIDVLLRGVPDVSIDSLHRPELAAFGAPALSLAVRSGSLRVLNAIGSAVFTHRAMAPFAHRMATQLIGEDLLLADAPCLWLGGDRAREQVIAERDLWRIEGLTSVGGTPELPEDPDELAAVLARVGERLCAVQLPALSRTPVAGPTGIVPAEWTMRVFACRTPDGWSVAPGGVAAPLAAGREIRPLGFGKDVWVPQEGAAAPAPQISTQLRAQFDSAHLRRTGRDLLSRVADEVFWLGRNAERAEAVLRTLGMCLHRHLEGNAIDADPRVLSALLEIHAPAAPGLEAPERYRNMVQRLAREAGEPGSVPAILANLSRGAQRGRSAISAEGWRHIDRLCSDRRWRTPGLGRHPAQLIRLIEDSLQALAAFAGAAQENLTRNYAWRFLEMGRRVERALQIAGLMQTIGGVKASGAETYLRAWLTLSDSHTAYRSRYMMSVQAAPVIDLLVLDETNPRALAFQVAALEGVLAEIPSDIPFRRPEHRRTLALLTELRLSDPVQLAEVTRDRRKRLAELAERVEADLSEISILVARSFFAHSDLPESVRVTGADGAPGHETRRPPPHRPTAIEHDAVFSQHLLRLTPEPDAGPVRSTRHRWRSRQSPTVWSATGTCSATGSMWQRCRVRTSGLEIVARSTCRTPGPRAG